MRALGLDLGSKRIGVALSDSAGRVATAYEVVDRSGDRRTDHHRIAALAEETGAEVIVVGLPRSLSGAEGRAAGSARREAAEIGRATGVAVETWDERFTTVTAHHDLSAAGVGSRRRRSIVDKVAAAVMLQAWLDHRRATTPGAHAP